MKIGDLVKLIQEPEVLRTNQDIPHESVGIVVEAPHPDIADFALSSAWIQWNGRSDWDSMFQEDLEVVSESR